jgi:hypothetical protein
VSWETVTSTETVVEPPRPVHVSEYDVLTVGDTALLPDRALAPLHPPLATHVDAFIDFHVIVVDDPIITVAGVAYKVMSGAGLSISLTNAKAFVVAIKKITNNESSLFIPTY